MNQHVAAGTTLRPFDGYRSFCARPEPERVLTHLADGRLTSLCGDTPLLSARVAIIDSGAHLQVQETAPDAARAAHGMLAALEALTAQHPEWAGVNVEGLPPAVAERLAAQGAIRIDTDGARCLPAMLWQLPALWLAADTVTAYPLLHTFTGDRRHPLRPPKPSGTVYARYVPWLDAVFSLRTATLEQDLARLHAWMNDPRIAEFWMEAGDLDHHTRYLSNLIHDPHMIPLAGCLDDVPFTHFEIYWAKENRVAPYYAAQDHDRGWHALVGDDRYRGKACLMAWFPAILHYQFLDCDRTLRIVGEPQADHHRQIANLERAGFSRIKEFDFPHKRALLVELTRERYFAERFYGPRVDLLQTLAQ